MSVSSSSLKKFLVTGATGFLASHTIRQLLANGYSVRGTVRSLNDKRLETLKAFSNGDRLEFVETNLNDDNGWKNAFINVHCVLHMASPVPGLTSSDTSMITTAVNGTRRVIEFASKCDSVKKFVFTSSGLVVTDMKYLQNHPNHIINDTNWLDENDETLPTYTRSKICAEKFVWQFMQTNKPQFDLIVINPFRIFGPILSPNIVSSSLMIIADILHGTGGKLPHCSIPSIDVRDVARVHVSAIDNQHAIGKRFLLVDQPSYWLDDLAKDLYDQFGSKGFKINREAFVDNADDRAQLNQSVAGIFRIRPIDFAIRIDNQPVMKVFEIDQLISVRQSIIDTATSMIENGMIQLPNM